MNKMQCARRAFAAGILLAVAAAGAEAGVLYSDGPINGTFDLGLINQYQIEDSFTLGGTSIIGGVTFGNWLISIDVPTSVDWSIVGSEGSQMPVCPACTGTASITGTYLFTNAYGYSIWDSSFSIPDITLGPGTYWLELQNEMTLFDELTGLPLFFDAGWDVNGGPSSSWDSITGDQTGSNCGVSAFPGFPGSCAESFEVLGVPEPGSLALLGTALLGLGIAARRRRWLKVG